MAQSTYSLSNDGTGYVQTSAEVFPNVRGPWTLAGWVKGNSSRCFLAGGTMASNSRSARLVFNSGVLNFTSDANAGGAAGWACDLSGGGWRHLLLAMPSGSTFNTDVKLYIDGTLASTTTSNDDFSPSNPGFVLGGRGSGSFGFVGKFDDWFVCGTDQSANAASIAAGSTDPATLSPLLLWRLEDGTGTSAADSSGGGHAGTLSGGVTWSSDVPTQLTGGGTITYTLSAAVGSFSLTGKTATLLVAHKMVTGLGTFTESGQIASLTTARKLVASAGVFTETGVTNSLIGTRILRAGIGSFSETGQVATLQAARKIVAAVGTFIETGVSTSLTTARKLVTVTGSYTVSGQVASFAIGHGLSAGVGSFVLAGQVATLTSTRKLIAGLGSYSLSGQDNSLTIAHKLTASLGQYNLTGLTLGVLRSYRVAAGIGTFTISGRNATLTYSGAIVVTIQSGGTWREDVRNLTWQEPTRYVTWVKS